MSSSRVKALAFATACVAGSAIAAGIAYGAAGHLDRSFGGDGLVTIPTISGNADGVTTDARERVVAVGSCPDSACMVRYTPHGHLDHSFSGDGKVIAKGFAAEAVAMDAGRILMAGDTVFGRPSAFVVARYGPNGHLDRSFGRRGTATTNMGGNFEDVHAVAVDSKGRIVVAGYINSREHQSSIAIARYLPSGKLDHSFGTRGKVIRSFPAFGLDGQVAIDSRNRIVAASSDSRNHFELMRFRQSGRLDRSFGDNGAITRIRGIAKAVAIDRRDRIVAAGLLFPRQFVVARFRTGGGLDRTFGTGGKVISSPPGGRGAFVYAAAIGSGGGIFVAGRSDGRFTVARYTPSGSLDRSFAGDGFAQKPGGGANALAIDGAGRPVAAGFHDNQFAVARYKGH